MRGNAPRQGADPVLGHQIGHRIAVASIERFNRMRDRVEAADGRQTHLQPVVGDGTIARLDGAEPIAALAVRRENTTQVPVQGGLR